jgi:hypothetical protein
LDVKGQAHEDRELSYKAIANRCKKLGADVTSQVHKRVMGLICTKTSVMNATQRVRKAIKNHIPLVDVTWLRDCETQCQAVDVDDAKYRLDELAKEAAAIRKDGENLSASGGTKVKSSAELETDGSEVDPSAGWSEPVSLGCCCVCHENGDDQCPWCVDGCENSTPKR